MTESEIMELKKVAAEKTGVPAKLINGETTEEIAASAIALAAYKRDSYEAKPTREKFAAWFNGDVPAESAPDPILTPPAYPNVPDGGTPQNLEYSRDPRDAFAEWFGDVSAFNPFKNNF